MHTHTATQPQLAAAFTEWERRRRADPLAHSDEYKRLGEQPPEVYGEQCAAELGRILTQQRFLDALCDDIKARMFPLSAFFNPAAEPRP